MLYVGIAGGVVKVETTSDVCRRQLLKDLEVFFDISATEPEDSELVATVAFGVSTTKYNAISEQGEMEPYRLISMHYPEQPRNRRFGRLSREGALEFVSHTTKKSNYELNYDQRRIEITNLDELAGSKDVRRVVRDQLLTYWLETKGGCVLHGASIVGNDRRCILVIGAGGSGKTSFFTTAASMEGFTPMAAETSIVLPKDDKMIVYAVPEKINFMPGTLTQFEELRKFAEHVPPSEYWKREHKFGVRWQDILEAFGRDVEENGIELGRILYSRYDAEFTLKPVTGDAAKSHLVSEIITGSDPITQNNWLNWFRRTEPLNHIVKHLTEKIPSYAVTWNSIDDIRKALSSLD